MREQVKRKLPKPKHCQQCGWDWMPRYHERPSLCPHCKSMRWDKGPRVRVKPEGA